VDANLARTAAKARLFYARERAAFSPTEALGLLIAKCVLRLQTQQPVMPEGQACPVPLA
jgi:hypothetical protein